MITAIEIIGTLGLAISLWVVFSRRYAVAGTTLTTARAWLLAGVAAWAGAWGATFFPDGIGEGIVDRLWYGVAVLMLCPPIAVLGAKRPGSRVWGWFVILPLLLVLGWPAVVWDGGSSLAEQPLLLEEPMVVGYGVVLVMGFGNYVGTRFAWPALFLAASLVFVVAPLSASVPAGFPEKDLSRRLATLFLTAAAIYGDKCPGRFKRPGHSAIDQIWHDFRHAFGIVWAKRIQDRVNFTAQKDDWPARLEPHGLVWLRNDLDAEARRQTETACEHTLRWLLRRFVDEAWIDARLDNSQ